MEKKEAMKILKDFHDKSALFSVRTALDTVFPELKESEDEKIRKELIAHFKTNSVSESWSGLNVKKVIAWLEKQGQQKYIPKYKIGDYVKNTNYKGEPIYEIIYMDKECYICEYRGKERMGDKAVMHFSFDNPYLCLVQKPADIEQNFSNSEKVGKNDTLLDLLHKMPPFITVDGVDYYFVMKKTSFYTAYYKAIGEEGSGNAIFGATAFSPIDLLNEMLEILKEKGLL